MVYINTLEEDIRKEEGYSINPYIDSLGNLTGGVGHKFTERDYKRWEDSWDDKRKKEYWAQRFKEDVSRSEKHALKVIEKYNISPDPIIKEVLIHMVFNLGEGGILKFPKFLKALKDKDIDKAILEMKTSKDGKKSKWYVQVPNRVDRLANRLEMAKGIS